MNVRKLGTGVPMRVGVCALAAGIGSVAAAQAADFGRERWAGHEYRPAPSYATPSRGSGYADLGFARDWWTGFYLGGIAGYGFGSASVDGSAGSFSHNLSGGLFGAVGGYNWRRDGVVYGLEGELKGGTVGGSAIVLGSGLQSDLRVMGSVRGRAGFLVAPALLVYGLAGVTAADFSLRGAVLGSGRSDEVFWGAQLGGGAEVKLTEQWSLRVDYTYNRFRPERIGALGFTNSYDPSFQALQAGIVYRF